MIRINKLILIATRKNGYNDVYGRSYDLNMTNGGQNALENFLANSSVLKRGGLNNITVANNLPNLVSMQNSPTHKVNIANNWGTQRLAFIMEDSEYHDPSLSGRIDPQVPFHINSIATVTKMVDPITNMLIATQAIEEITDDKFKLIRPSDVISGIGHVTTFGRDSGLVRDTVSDLSAASTSSDRGNNSPIKYLTKTINSYVHNLNTPGYEEEDNLMLATAEYASDHSLVAIPFINALYNQTGVPAPTVFNIDILSRMDPDIQNKILLIENGSTLVPNTPTSILDTNNTEVNYKPTIEATIANIVAHSVTDLLVSNLLATVDFSVSNRMGPPLVVISNVRSFMDGIDVTSYANKLSTGVEAVLMPEITQNGLLMIELLVHSDLLTETTVSVSVNAAPPVVFRFPTFADSLFSLCNQLV